MKRIPVLAFILFILAGCIFTGTPAKPTLTPFSLPTRTLPAAEPTESETATAAHTETTALITAGNASHLKQVSALAIDYPYRLYFSMDNRQAYVTSQDQTIGFSIPALQQESQLPVIKPAILLNISPAANLAALTSDHQTIDLVDLQNGRHVKSFQPQGQFSEAFFTPDGAALGVISLDEIRVDLYDVSSGSLIRQFRGFQTAAPVYNVLPAGDGKTLAWISRGRLQLMNFASGQLGPEFSHEDFISGWTLSPDGKLLVTSAGGQLDGEFLPLIFIWDAHTGQQISTIKVTDAPAASLAFTPDGRILAAAVGNKVQLYRAPDWNPLVSLGGPTERISFLTISPDGRSLLASASDNRVYLWQVVP